MSRVALWSRASRAPLYTASGTTAIIGGALTYYDTGRLDPLLFILTTLGAMLMHAGATIANDYYDHETGNDDVNEDRTPFAGGTGVIQEGLLTPKAVLRAALLCWGLGAAVGLYLAWRCGWPVLALGLFGFLSGYFYTAGPVRLAYRGFGEAVLGLNFGPVIVAGAYFVQTGSFAPQAWLAGAAIGFFVTGILFINQFPDYAADRATHKRNLVVRLGTARAVHWYLPIVLSGYAAVAAGVVLGWFPWTALIALATLPLVLGAHRLARVHHASPRALIPANAATVKAQLLTGNLLSVSLVVARWVGL